MESVRIPVSILLTSLELFNNQVYVSNTTRELRASSIASSFASLCQHTSNYSNSCHVHLLTYLLPSLDSNALSPTLICILSVLSSQTAVVSSVSIFSPFSFLSNLYHHPFLYNMPNPCGKQIQ